MNFTLLKHKDNLDAKTIQPTFNYILIMKAWVWCNNNKLYMEYIRKLLLVALLIVEKPAKWFTVGDANRSAGTHEEN